MYDKLGLFVDFNNDIEKLQDILDIAKRFNYIMASDFNNNISTAAELYNNFRRYNHGNCKIILHFYYNPLTDKKEISYGTRATFRSYPQYKNIVIRKW